MSGPPISWPYRLEVRQAVPILVGLAGFLVLLLSFGYFYARDQILLSTRAQVTLIAGSITRHDAYVRQWLERAMQPVAHLAATFPALDEEARRAADASMASMISDEWGHQVVEVGFLDGRGSINFRRYGSGVASDRGSAVPGSWTAKDIDALKAPVWHRPTIGDDRTLTLYYTVPLFASAGEGAATIGLCDVHLTIDWFADRVRSFSSFKDEITFFLAPDGSWTLPAEGDAQLAALKARLLVDPATEVGVTWNDRSYVTVVMPLGDSGILMGLMIPREGLLGALDRLTRLLGGIGLVVLLIAAYGLHRTISAVLAPLGPLNRLAERLAYGDLEAGPEAPVDRRAHRFPDEAERLARSTEKLRRALHQRLSDLVLLGRTRERLFGELTFARRMQEAQRPQMPPPTNGLEIAAYVHTAGEVCGDMYDYFLVGPRRLCCVMGNVAERGVPAALLSGRVIPLLHELLLSGLSPGRALDSVNRILVTSTGAAPMVSLFAGALDLDSGVLRWACAGQMPPFRRSGEAVEQLAWTGNMPLGIRDRETYSEEELCLSSGDVLLFCGPRLPSVPNAAGRSFGETALRDFLVEGRDMAPAVLLSGLYARLRKHAGGPPRDDLTFFAVRWKFLADAAPAGTVVPCAV